MFEKLKWTADSECGVCVRSLPEGYDGFTGTGAGMHVVVVAWSDNGILRADGAITHLTKGVVEHMTPEASLAAAAAARTAVAQRAGGT